MAALSRAGRLADWAQDVRCTECTDTCAQLMCGHLMCSDCLIISKVLRRKVLCPVCGTDNLGIRLVHNSWPLSTLMRLELFPPERAQERYNSPEGAVTKCDRCVDRGDPPWDEATLPCGHRVCASCRHCALQIRPYVICPLCSAGDDVDAVAGGWQ